MGAAPGYRWWRHVELVAAFTAGGLWLAAAGLDRFGVREWLVLGVMLVAINLGEYAAHRWQLHVRRFPRAVHHRHVVEHHCFFTAERMAVDTADDVRWVLFPPWALPLLVVSVLPFFLALGFAASAEAAWLLLLAVLAYYGVYEVLHTLAHLPASHALAGLGPVQALTRHHRLHHDPALMRRWNFNFAVPIGDWLFGTLRR
jgi:sterol desaturase/sphingolipid hydroxylase (fatty acid hydroxylase superfamily)